MATPDEVRARLDGMSVEERSAFDKDFGASKGTDTRARVNEFINRAHDPSWRLAFCNALGLKTEEQKTLDALQASAKYTKLGGRAMVATAIIAFVSLAVSILALVIAMKSGQ